MYGTYEQDNLSPDVVEDVLVDVEDAADDSAKNASD